MIIMRHEPFSAVEDPDFRAYQRALNKKALIYTNRSFKDLLRLRTLSKRENLLEFFVIQASGQDMLQTPSSTAKLPRYAAVTSDSWTSAKKETYTSLSQLLSCFCNSDAEADQWPSCCETCARQSSYDAGADQRPLLAVRVDPDFP